MIISSWNVNSVRARIENIKEYIKKFSPDVLMMQEIKTPDETYPYDDIRSLKYENYVFGQKSYNGVAIISKKKLSNINNDIFKDKLKQSRIISADLKYKNKNIQIINIYTPNGNPVDTEKYDYKIYWLDSLIKKINKILKENSNIIIGGDFNVIPSDEDVYSPENFKNDACAHPTTRKYFRKLISLGFIDTVKFFIEGKTNWTFWGYRGGNWQKGNGLRIDHFLTTPDLTDLIKKVEVNREPRGWEKASDHTPVTIEFNN